jgi:NADPH-dependent 2,4-dienoyl-CoA reductase/sulfur reductase-like enzyme
MRFSWLSRSTFAAFPYSPTCSINPVIGNELKWEQTYKPTDDRKHVVVVGGGLAGTEAARVAAMRGHKVTLLERGKRLGGQLLLAMATPGRDDFEDQVYFEENEVERLGVEVKLESQADAATIRALKPGAVVIATGSVPRVPSAIPGVDLPHVVQAWDVLSGKAKVGNRVAIVSQEDYYETPCVAEYLGDRGKHVEIFTKSVHLGFEIARYSVGMVIRRMEECGVAVHPNLVLNAITPDALELVSAYGPTKYRKEGFDTVVLVYGSVPAPQLYEELKAAGDIPNLYVAGSAWLPRFMAEAARHGASIGLVI